LLISANADQCRGKFSSRLGADCPDNFILGQEDQLDPGKRSNLKLA